VELRVQWLEAKGDPLSRLDTVIDWESTVGMYGDLQGIAGSTIQEIEGLEFKALGESAHADLKLDGK
jgi:hypothetical protein